MKYKILAQKELLMNGYSGYQGIEIVERDLPLDDSPHFFYYLLDKNEAFHHEDKPSLIIISSSKKLECYYQHGILYHKKLPAISFRELDGPGFSYDKFHTKHQLSKIAALLTKNILLEMIEKSERKSLNTQNHHFNLTDWRSLQNIVINSDLHREGDPAFFHYNRAMNGEPINWFSYYKDNLLHREDGPAYIISGKKDGTIIKEKWYLEGKEI